MPQGSIGFETPHGRVVYVGKAKSLRSRLSSYFQDLAHLHPRTQTMVTTAASVDWTVVANEVEALQLEYSWIKEYDPRFNVKYRDDKSYPSLAVTVGEEYPRLQVMRGPKRKGVRYYGPYSHAWAIRDTLDLLLRVFPARTCSSVSSDEPLRSGGPVCWDTSASAPPLAWVPSPSRSTVRSSTTSARSWMATRPPTSDGSSARCGWPPTRRSTSEQHACAMTSAR